MFGCLRVSQVEFGCRRWWGWQAAVWQCALCHPWCGFVRIQGSALLLAQSLGARFRLGQQAFPFSALVGKIWESCHVRVR